MFLRTILLIMGLLLTASASQSAVKVYSSDGDNGIRGDVVVFGAESGPVESLEALQGHHQITDDSTGTVTLDVFMSVQDRFSNFGPDILTDVLGPGAFFFAELTSTLTINAAKTSNTSGIGAHGPSSTAPGETAEWGVLSGFEITGADFCLSSPISVCNQNGFAHGATVPSQQLGSTTYDLGTWNFDAVGDMEAAAFYITRTASGGTSNVTHFIRGTFHGASLPALPLVGFGALAVGLVVVGARAMAARK
jgi:hypothetical protein